MSFNLLAFSTFSFKLHNFNIDFRKQSALAYTSTIITLMMFVGMAIYHVTLLIKMDKTSETLNEYPLAQVQPIKSKEVITHTSIHVGTLRCLPPKSSSDKPACL